MTRTTSSAAARTSRRGDRPAPLSPRDGGLADCPPPCGSDYHAPTNRVDHRAGATGRLIADEAGRSAPRASPRAPTLRRRLRPDRHPALRLWRPDGRDQLALVPLLALRRALRPPPRPDGPARFWSDGPHPADADHAEDHPRDDRHHQRGHPAARRTRLRSSSGRGARSPASRSRRVLGARARIDGACVPNASTATYRHSCAAGSHDQPAVP